MQTLGAIMLSLRRLSSAGALVGAATLLAVTSTQAGLWSRSLLDFAPTCIDSKTGHHRGGTDSAIDSGAAAGQAAKLRLDKRGAIEDEIEQIAFSLGRESVAPSYPIPSVITEWATSTGCSDTK